MVHFKLDRICSRLKVFIENTISLHFIFRIELQLFLSSWQAVASGNCSTKYTLKAKKRAYFIAKIELLSIFLCCSICGAK